MRYRRHDKGREGPCTCAYLPGKSQVHVVVVLVILLLVGVVRRAARVEIEALQSPAESALLLAILFAVWAASAG